MKQETIDILRELGFSLGSQLTLPCDTELHMRLSIMHNGTGTVVFCNGGLSEYETLLNHGAKPYHMKTLGNGTPYLTLSLSRLRRILTSVAQMRVLASSAKSIRRAHQRLANDMVKKWIAALPDESNPLYICEYAGRVVGDYCAKLGGGDATEDVEQEEVARTPLFEQKELAVA